MYICQVCKKAPATIHLTDIHNNIKKEVHLCETCAAEKGFNMQTAANLPQLLGLAAKKKAEAAAKPAKPIEEDIRCPMCGHRWSDFKNRGRLGCPNDYQAFGLKMRTLVANQLAPGVSSGESFHTGKTPSGKTVAVDPARSMLRELERRLRQAVAGEHYEEAARLKAEIDKLRKSADNNDSTPDSDNPQL